MPYHGQPMASINPWVHYRRRDQCEWMAWGTDNGQYQFESVVIGVIVSDCLVWFFVQGPRSYCHFIFTFPDVRSWGHDFATLMTIVSDVRYVASWLVDYLQWQWLWYRQFLYGHLWETCHGGWIGIGMERHWDIPWWVQLWASIRTSWSIYAKSDKVAKIVWFYYMSNAYGRLFGIIQSGTLYMYVGEYNGDKVRMDGTSGLGGDGVQLPCDTVSQQRWKWWGLKWNPVIFKINYIFVKLYLFLSTASRLYTI